MDDCPGFFCFVFFQLKSVYDPEMQLWKQKVCNWSISNSLSQHLAIQKALAINPFTKRCKKVDILKLKKVASRTQKVSTSVNKTPFKSQQFQQANSPNTGIVK